MTETPESLGHEFDSKKDIVTNRCKKCGLSITMVNLSIKAFKNDPKKLNEKFTCVEITGMFKRFGKGKNYG